jgi:hypothetical protein
MKNRILSIATVFLLIAAEPENASFTLNLPANLSNRFKRSAYEVVDDWTLRKVKNGIQWDTHILAPLGGPASSTRHPYTLYYTYKIMHAFNSKITLMQASGYFPVIFSILSIIHFAIFQVPES